MKTLSRRLGIVAVYTAIVLFLVWLADIPPKLGKWPSEWALLTAIGGGDATLWDNVGGPGELLNESLEAWGGLLIGLAAGLVGLAFFWPATRLGFWKGEGSFNQHPALDRDATIEVDPGEEKKGRGGRPPR